MAFLSACEANSIAIILCILLSGFVRNTADRQLPVLSDLLHLSGGDAESLLQVHLSVVGFPSSSHLLVTSTLPSNSPSSAALVFLAPLTSPCRV